MVVFCLLAAVQLALGVGLEHILHSAWADCVLTVRLGVGVGRLVPVYSNSRK